MSFNQSSIIQRSLYSASNSYATAMKRLSTGCRINGASDDAAGLSLSNKLSSSISGLNIANQNTQNGISYLNVGEGALSAMTKDVQRIRNLAVQAANGVYSNSERAMLNQEAQQLKTGLQQTIDSTTFADKKIFGNDSTAPAVSHMSEADALAAGHIVIKTAADFVNLVPQTGAGTAGKTYMLMGDIDMSSIANYIAKTNFAGTFDGNGYTMSGLTINKPAVNYQGLFGTANNGAQFQNVTLNNFDIKGHGEIGGLLGIGQTITMKNINITNSRIHGNGWDTGGLVGYIVTPTVENCHSSAQVSGNEYVAGLIGYVGQGGTITKSSSTGSASANDIAGGLLGGHLGYGYLLISESFSSASVSSINSNAGGFIGQIGYDIADMTIRNCYSTGSVNSPWGGNGFIGGDVAYGGIIENCYSSGAITGTGGGFSSQWPSGTYTNNFWNTDTSGKTTGFGPINGAGVTGITSAQAANSATFTGAGFSDAIWDFSNPGSPQLDWQKTSTPTSEETGLELQIGKDNNANSRLAVDTSFNLGTFNVDLSSAAGARDAIDQCDKLLKDMIDKQSYFGASLNRLGSMLNSQRTTSDNLSASKSIILDADMAVETAKLMKSQILQQVSTNLFAKYKSSYSDLLLTLLK